MSFNELGNPRSHLSTTPGKVRTFHFDIFMVIAVLALCGCFLLLKVCSWVAHQSDGTDVVSVFGDKCKES